MISLIPSEMAAAACMESLGFMSYRSIKSCDILTTNSFTSRNCRYGNSRSFLPSSLESSTPSSFLATHVTSSHVSSDVHALTSPLATLVNRDLHISDFLSWFMKENMNTFESRYIMLVIYGLFYVPHIYLDSNVFIF